MVLGVAYKADVGDVRESPAIKTMEALQRRGAKVSFNDPLVDSVSLNGTEVARTPLTQRSVSRADCVAILTPHRAYDLDWISQAARLVFDARNAFNGDRRRNVVRL
jgi:UDP-N-acetyl-D-glucosamine dehydrogenase